MQADWDAFVEWLKEDLELPNLPIEWSRYEGKDTTIIRIDLCKDRPYHVTTAVEDRPELCNHEVSYRLSRGLLPTLTKAIDENKAYTYIPYFRVEARV